jgi:hypothetical protein
MSLGTPIVNHLTSWKKAVGRRSGMTAAGLGTRAFDLVTNPGLGSARVLARLASIRLVTALIHGHLSSLSASRDLLAHVVVIVLNLFRFVKFLVYYSKCTKACLAILPRIRG